MRSLIVRTIDFGNTYKIIIRQINFPSKQIIWRPVISSATKHRICRQKEKQRPIQLNRYAQPEGTTVET